MNPVLTDPVIRPGLLSPQDCRRMVDVLQRQPGAPALSYDPATGRVGVDETRVCSIVEAGPLAAELRAVMRRVAEEVVLPEFGVRVQAWEEPSVASYGPGGHFDAHSDGGDDDGAEMRRDVSVLLYLNDDFTGGGLEFTGTGQRVEPRAGMLVAFPSRGHVHRVEPVREGRRWVVICFMMTEG